MYGDTPQPETLQFLNPVYLQALSPVNPKQEVLVGFSHRGPLDQLLPSRIWGFRGRIGFGVQGLGLQGLQGFWLGFGSRVLVVALERRPRGSAGSERLSRKRSTPILRVSFRV